MHLENTIEIHSPVDRIFAAASDLSLWPAILPHYRFIEYLERSGERNIVRMGAARGWIPVTWTAEQRVDPERLEIRFLHRSWITRGMTVVWTFTRKGDRVVVRIIHDLDPRMPLVGRFFAEKIVGRFFISHIAGQTLFHMKRFAEHDGRA